MITTTDELVAKIRVKGRIPDSSPDYTAAVILSEADDVISERLVEAISSLRQGLYVVVEDVATVSGQASYSVPGMAAAEALESVTMLRSDGTERPMHRFDASDVHWISGSSQGLADSYIIAGDTAVLSRPPSDTSEYVRFRYTTRRNAMVPVSSTMLLASLSAGPTLVFDDSHVAYPASFTGEVSYHIVRAGLVGSVVPGIIPFNGGGFSSPPPPLQLLVSGGDASAFDDVRYETAAADGYAVRGDRLAVTGESCYIQVPVELHTALANGTAAAILGQMGFKEEAATCYSMMERGVASYKALAASRVKNAPIKLVNRFSPLRMRSRYR